MPILSIDNQPYQIMVEGLEMSSDGSAVYFRAAHQIKVVNKCDCCGRFDMEPAVYTSLEEVIAAGWLVPVKKE